jgi:hypothetical protein
MKRLPEGSRSASFTGRIDLTALSQEWRSNVAFRVMSSCRRKSWIVVGMQHPSTTFFENFRTPKKAADD